MSDSRTPLSHGRVSSDDSIREAWTGCPEFESTIIPETGGCSTIEPDRRHEICPKHPEIQGI
jgi:hypothetical protein